MGEFHAQGWFWNPIIEPYIAGKENTLWTGPWPANPLARVVIPRDPVSGEASEKADACRDYPLLPAFYYTVLTYYTPMFMLYAQNRQ